MKEDIPSKKIIILLESAAFIIQKYSLGDYNYFVNIFKKFNNDLLASYWDKALEKTKNIDIISDATYIDFDDEQIVKDRYDNTLKDLKHLKSKLFYKNLSLRNLNNRRANIERRLYILLAKDFIKLIKREILVKQPSKYKINFTIYKYRFPVFLFIIITTIFYNPIKDRLTPVGRLAEKIHENSKYKYDGAKCNDGTYSTSQGSGTCSWHNGVNYYFYKGEFKKTVNQSYLEAKEKSWVGE